MTPMRSEAPSEEDLASELGAAEDIWNAIIASVAEKFRSIGQE